MDGNQTRVEWAQANIAGSYRSSEEAAQRLVLAAQHCNLVGGATMCPLKIGHQIVIAVVPIHIENAYPVNKTAKALAKGNGVDPQHPDYEPPRWGAGKADLTALAAAAGVQWTKCERLDDKSDPYFCHYRVTGEYPAIDGSMRRIENERDVDLRDGSPQIAGMSDFRVQNLRENMIRLAITKARLRAIREAFGVPHSMTAEELEKPWVFCRMIFTGHSDDPAIQHLFAQVVATKQLAGANSLYGQLAGGAIPTLALPGLPTQAALPPAAAPAVAALPPHVDFDENDIPDEPPPLPKASPPPPPPPQAKAPPAQQQPSDPTPTGRPRTGFKVPGGKEKNADLADASDGTLKYWAERKGKELNDGTCPEKYREYTEKLHRALLAEISSRSGQREF